MSDKSAVVTLSITQGEITAAIKKYFSLPDSTVVKFEATEENSCPRFSHATASFKKELRKILPD